MLSDYLWNLQAKIGSELIQVPLVAAVILNANDQILLQENDGTQGWSLPAGVIEVAETPQEALARQVQQNTGLELLSTQLLDVFGGKAFRYIHPNGNVVEYTVIVFNCVTEGQPNARVVQRHKLRYFARSQMPTLALPYPKDVLFRHSRERASI
ncbi:NUDIX domain-containing protein [Advenella mimigardefordensis]|uniref:NUDIX hydrolase domain-containing protein n=1 Tax=Advenella mimigardefordensis (strain DSM 17166 / LMG 22922 / DPN7) TaxID=1247726 RepID=W0PDM6_ADVMD|nr:NUDIX domain-containing protein [Advenella mimigardefordensis]AHG64851.1 NUDIX hydrolase domain-containing protein [Advenella mimigardefordensis DPN7]